MNHDVFISYSSKNKQVADAIVHYLEESKIRCWIAPRDIIGGAEYADVITDAIKNSRVLVLVYSGHSAISRFCKQETNLALASGKVIIPFKIDSSRLSGSMEFYLNDKHWIDAFPNPEQHFGKLVNAIRRFLLDKTDIDDPGVLRNDDALPPPNNCLRFITVSISTITGVLGLIGCGFVIAAVTHIGNVYNQWRPWMFWAYPFLMPTILMVGICMAQKHHVVFVRKCLFPRKYNTFASINVRRVSIGVLRILTAWFFVLYGLFVVVGMPIIGCAKLNGGFAITRDNLANVLGVVCMVPCWGYLLLKTGWAIMDENWAKFQFAPKRLARCIFMIILPFLIGILFMLIFTGLLNPK